ncbi:hypothetical protein TIFTF001_033049, partial [Ficus carica]
MIKSTDFAHGHVLIFRGAFAIAVTSIFEIVTTGTAGGMSINFKSIFRSAGEHLLREAYQLLEIFCSLERHIQESRMKLKVEFLGQASILSWSGVYVVNPCAYSAYSCCIPLPLKVGPLKSSLNVCTI